MHKGERNDKSKPVAFGQALCILMIKLLDKYTITNHVLCANQRLIPLLLKVPFGANLEEPLYQRNQKKHSF